MKFLPTLSLCVCASLATGAFGWTLENEASSLSYVSIKNADVAEPNRFVDLSGKIADDGSAEIKIAMDSAETYIDIRNERVKEHLFQVETYPLAILSAKLDMAQFENLPIGATKLTEFEVSVNANGETADYVANANVTRVGEDRVSVTSTQPIIMYADDLGYEAGIAKLREIAELTSIQLAVPVSFALMFEK